MLAEQKRLAKERAKEQRQMVGGLVCAGVGFDPFYCTLMLYSTCLAVTGDFISETAHKAAVAKRLQKAQREAALEAVKMAKRERGFYKIPIFVSGYGMNFF